MRRPREREEPTQSMIRNFRLLDLLPTMDPDEQLEVFERVLQSPRPQVRQRALGVGAAILSDSRLLAYLHEDDELHRSAAVEMLKLRRQRSLSLAVHLLADEDPEVVAKAIEILLHLGDLAAVEPLVAVVDGREEHTAVEAAVRALGTLRDARAVPALLRVLERRPWLRRAAMEALGELGSADAVPTLAAHLADDRLAPDAADALARIGGLDAVTALAAYWLRHADALADESTLRRIAELLERLARPPEGLDHLEAVLQERAQDERKALRVAAVRCLVALRGKNRGLWMF